MIYAHRFDSSREQMASSVKVSEFDKSLLQHYSSPTAPNVIILLLIADTTNDSCIASFLRQINLIKEYENPPTFDSLVLCAFLFVAVAVAAAIVCHSVRSLRYELGEEGELFHVSGGN